MKKFEKKYIKNPNSHKKIPKTEADADDPCQWQLEVLGYIYDGLAMIL
jgi:hypothetical protein